MIRSGLRAGLCLTLAMSSFFMAAQGQAQITIRAVGDVMPGSYTPQRIIPPDSGRQVVAGIARYLRGADLVFGNFESTFVPDHNAAIKPRKCSETSRRKGICFEFGSPPHLVQVLQQLGFTTMSVDNNHADDYGVEAAEYTKLHLREHTIIPAPKRGVATLNVGSQRIAVIAFGFSATSYLLTDTTTAREVITEARKTHTRVIVSFHGGAEGKKAQHIPNNTEMFYGENRGNLRVFAHACVDAGADLVIGHGPHVLRAMEIYKDRLIAYSLGNFFTYGNMNLNDVNGISCILEARLDPTTGKFLGGRVIPVIQKEPGIPVFDEQYQSVRLLQQLNRQDFPSTGVMLDDRGMIIR